MTEPALVKATRKGQIAIPQALREEPDIEPGTTDLRPLMGAILIWARSRPRCRR
jgi:hypothetical protein